ncbi:MAG TPA: N-methyl-L-tryptophan oxidase [Acidimicrobiia bacterium]
MTDYDIIVLGQGGIGSAAAYWASRREGVSVLGIEQYPFGHDNGGSEDHSRIIRLSYHTPAYVALAKEAYRAWEALEIDSGTQVVLKTGGLDLAPADAAISLDAYRNAMTAEDVEFDELSASEIMGEWPQWSLGDDVTALYQQDSGIAMASIANATHRTMARQHGATLLENVRVESISESGEEVSVVTGQGVFTADSLIVAGGAWTNLSMQHFGIEFPLEVTQEQVVYLTPLDQAEFAPGRFPIWIWMDVPSFYGFPIFGEPAVKVAWDRCELVTDPEHRSHTPRDDVTNEIRTFAAQHLPSSNGGVHLARTCLYTLTPDRDFIVDRVPGTSRVFCAVGAGHAFKFASVLGKILVDLAVDGSTPHDISAFTADRAVLTDPNPPRNYLV